MNTQLNSHVNFPVVKIVHTAPGLSQRKEVSPGATGCCQKEYQLKYVKGVSRVTQLSCVKPVTDVSNVASNLPVGARLTFGKLGWIWVPVRRLFKSLKRATPSPSRPGPTWQDLQTS